MRKWTISEIKQANAEAGHVFFDKSHTKSSKTLPGVFQGPGGVVFMTSDSDGITVPEWKAWIFDVETAAIRMLCRGNDIEGIVQAAKDYAKGGE